MHPEMLYWTPANDTTETWEPHWNPTFSDAEKLECTNLFFFFHKKKGFKEQQAKTLAQMAVFKKKYNALKYSPEQELLLQQALKPVFNS
jgi:hypothetical protein